VSLTPSTRIGSYEVTGPIGAGGMGEVYRARDTRLGRDVTLKVLPDQVARDSERLARFEREAHVLASLNHPNIAAIYGMEPGTAAGNAGATGPVLVMEFVEGPTLADRIERGPLPLDEAVPIAREIAAGGQRYQLTSLGFQHLDSRSQRRSGFEVVSVATSPTIAFGNPVAVPKTVFCSSSVSTESVRRDA